MTIERYIPSIENLNENYSTLFSDNNEKTVEDYIREIQKHEIHFEEQLIEVFKGLGIQATTKTDRYSLPYTRDFTKHSKYGVVCYTLNFSGFTRKVVLELLQKEITKIRFYLTGDLLFERATNDLRLKNTVTLKFRYFIHN